MPHAVAFSDLALSHFLQPSSREAFFISPSRGMHIENFHEATGGIMTPEHRAQMRRLTKLRESARIAAERAANQPMPAPVTIKRPSQAQLTVEGAEDDVEDGVENDNAGNKQSVNKKSITKINALLDPLIYPGLYAPSGLNIISILIRVHQRPNPKIDLGFIDSSCALLLCDLSLPDMPIVYVSEPFTQLTRYTPSDILGKNCRFLQSPSGLVVPGSKREFTDDDAVKELKEKLAKREEHQVVVANYKKGGERFENVLTVVPISWEGTSTGDARYVVGFQADRKVCFLGPPPPPTKMLPPTKMAPPTKPSQSAAQ